MCAVRHLKTGKEIARTCLLLENNVDEINATGRLITIIDADNCAKLSNTGMLMKRKPDILWVLVAVFGLGVVTSAYAQSYWANQSDAPSSPAVQVAAKR
jgi:hypothetical protein